METNKLDDPLWEYMLVTRLQPYIPAVRKWWSEYEQHELFDTGSAPLSYDDVECPAGLYIRTTYTPARSPIKNVQAFPYVPTAYLQIVGVAGGANRMIERVCKNGLMIDEFSIIEKHNLPSTVQQGQFVAFVPTNVLQGVKKYGRYVYFTIPELIQMANGIIPGSAKMKLAKYASLQLN